MICIYTYIHTHIYIHIQIAFLQIIYLFSQVPGCVHYHPELPIDTHNYMCITIYYHPFLYIITHDCPVKTILMIHLYSDVLPWGEQTWPENKPFIDDSPSEKSLHETTEVSIVSYVLPDFTGIWPLDFPHEKSSPFIGNCPTTAMITTGICGTDRWRGLNCFNFFPSWHRGR